ncbi:MAG TPA: hypothetical protein ENF73_02905, partial [Proteobacteria bacterium]|nr:hypothetical protein [Pseudomonadota bacterium]
MKRDRSSIGPLAILAALVVVIWFLPELLGRKAFFYFDLAGVHLPQRAFVAESLKRGVFPFWCPLKACGFPLFAEGQTGILYPFNLLSLVLPVWWSNNIITVVHILIAFFGTYLYIRRQGLSDAAGCIAGLSYSMSSFMLAHHIHPPMFQAFCWLGFVMIAAETLPEKADRGILISAVFLGFALIAGHTQAFVIVVAAFFARLLIFAIDARGLKDAARLIGYGLVALAAVLLIFAPYVVAQVEFVLRSYRAKLTGGEFFLVGSLEPRALFNLFIRGLTGDLYDASFTCGGEAIWEGRLYFGIVP